MKRKVLLSVVLCILALGSLWGQYSGTFKPISSVEELEEGLYVIAFLDHNNAGFYAMTNMAGNTTSQLAAQPVTLTNENIVNPTTVTVMRFERVPETTYWAVKHYEGTGYLRSGSTTALNLGGVININTAHWTVSNLSVDDRTFNIVGAATETRFIRYTAATTCVGNFASSSMPPQYSHPQLYKLDTRTPAPTFSPSAGVYYDPINVTITRSATEEIVRYTTDGSEPTTTYGVLYDGTAIPVSATTTIKAIAFVDGSAPSEVAIATYIFPTDRTSIANLKATTPNDSTAYRITGNMVVIWTVPEENGKYLVDADNGAGIYVTEDVEDSEEPIMPNTYVIGDMIHNLVGYYDVVEGQCIFVPAINPGAPTSQNVTVTPATVTFASMVASPETYQSRLLKVEDVIFPYVLGGHTFPMTAHQYTVFDGTAEFTFRTHFSIDDFADEAVPFHPTTVIGILGSHNDPVQHFFAPRTMSDIDEAYGDLILPPRNVVAELSANIAGAVELTWDAPSLASGAFTHNADHTSFTIPSTTPTGTVIFGHRYTAADLVTMGVAGTKLHSVGFIPGEAGTYYALVSVGGYANPFNPGNFVEQANFIVESEEVGQLKVFQFAQPADIPTTREMWIGFQKVTSSGNVAAVDNETAVANQGNLYSTDMGLTWQSYGTNNWVIVGYASIDGTPNPAPSRALTHYNIYRNGGQIAINASPITTTSYTDTEPLFEDENTYIVTAMYDGGFTANSDPVIIDTTPPAFPQNPPRFLAGDFAMRPIPSITLTWSQPLTTTATFERYVIYRDDVADSLASHGTVITDTVFVDNNVASMDEYTYTVKAVYTQGPSILSNPAIVNTTPLFNPPTNLTVEVNADTTSFELTWQPPLDDVKLGTFSHYEIYKNGSLFDTTTADAIDDTTYTDNNVFLNIRNSYYVVAVYTEGTSDASDTAYILILGPTMPYDGAGKFAKITSLTDMEDGFYMITASPTSGIHAMNKSLSTGTSGYFGADLVSAELTTDLFENPLTTQVWYFESTGTNQYRITTDFAYGSGAGQAVNLAATGQAGPSLVDIADSDMQKYTISEGAGGFNILNVAFSSNNRYLRFRSDLNPMRFNFVNTTQGGSLIVTLYKMLPSDGTTTPAPSISHDTGIYADSFYVTLSSPALPNVDIYYTLDGTEPDSTSTLYTVPILINTAGSLKAISYFTGFAPSPVVTKTYTFPTPIANIAALRALPTTDTNIYKITNDVVVIQRQPNVSGSNQIYIVDPDNAAGILIWDNTGVLTADYQINNVINGLVGRLNPYQGLLQFAPVLDAGAIVSDSLYVAPHITTLAEIADSISVYQGRLLTVNNVVFTGHGNFSETVGTNYPITDGTASFLFRTNFSTGCDYLGRPIPQNPINLTGIVSTRSNTEHHIAARNLADMQIIHDLYFPAPRNLVGEQIRDGVNLVWDTPMAGGMFTHATADEAEDYIGVPSYAAGLWTIVQRFSPEQLFEMGVAGKKLEKVDIMTNDATATYRLMVWIGGTGPTMSNPNTPFNPGVPVYDQQISNVTPQVWTEVYVHEYEDIMIPTTREMWIGFSAYTAGDILVAGVDAGPVVDGYGNLVKTPDNAALEGVNLRNQWTLLQAVQQAMMMPTMNVNWMIRAHASEEGNRNTRAMTGYNVYRDGTLIGSTALAVRHYLDETTLPHGLYTYSVTALYTDGMSDSIHTVVDVGEVSDTEIPAIITALQGNYPNPFNPSTTIEFGIRNSEIGMQNVTIDIYNIKGQKVRSLVNSVYPAGNHRVVWNGTDDNGRAVSSGIYFYRMKTDNYTATKKMILMK